MLDREIADILKKYPTWVHDGGGFTRRFRLSEKEFESWLGCLANLSDVKLIRGKWQRVEPSGFEVTVTVSSSVRVHLLDALATLESELQS